MLHYICVGGCHGISHKPGNCQDKDCQRRGLPLKECDCTDNRHYGALGTQAATEDYKNKKK